MISNFFILSPRGDTIITKDYRLHSPSLDDNNNDAGDTAGEGGSLPTGRFLQESFFRRVQFWNEFDEDEKCGGVGGGGYDAHDGAGAEGQKDGEGENDDDLNGKNKIKRDAPPVFPLTKSIHAIHIRRSGLLFVMLTTRNASPSVCIELLAKISKVFKDYCGTLSEESIRKNFILLYELLDEMIDFGYPQVTQTENLRAFVYNEPVVVKNPLAVKNSNSSSSKTASAASVHKPVSTAGDALGGSGAGARKNEIFVDILERINVLFSPNGYVLNSSVDGCIQMKSYLAGNPELRLALNEDLVIGSLGGGSANGGEFGSVVLDDCNFNDCCNLSEFGPSRVLTFRPPDGEFVVLNYRMTSEFRCPFKIFPHVEEIDPFKISLTVTVRADMPDNHAGTNVFINVPVPRDAVSVYCEHLSAGASTPPPQGHTTDFSSRDKKVKWNVAKFVGQSEFTVKMKITLDKPATSATAKEIGPISMNFEIPVFNVSKLQVRYLRIADVSKDYSPFRWVRYVTQSSSYVCRV